MKTIAAKFNLYWPLIKGLQTGLAAGNRRGRLYERTLSHLQHWHNLELVGQSVPVHRRQHRAQHVVGSRHRCQ